MYIFFAQQNALFVAFEDLEIRLDELLHRLNLFLRLHNHPGAAKVVHLRHRVRMILLEFAGALFGKAGHVFRPRLDIRTGERDISRFRQLSASTPRRIGQIPA